jgi:hypothetical protein
MHLRTLSVAVAMTVLVGGALLLFLGAPLQPCGGMVALTPEDAAAQQGRCEAERPAWLATLDPIARLEAEQPDLVRGVALAGGPVAGLVIYLTGTLASRRRRAAASVVT